MHRKLLQTSNSPVYRTQYTLLPCRDHLAPSPLEICVEALRRGNYTLHPTYSCTRITNIVLVVMAANEGRRVRVNGTQHLHSIVLAHGFPRLEAGSLSFSEIARAQEPWNLRLRLH